MGNEGTLLISDVLTVNTSLISLDLEGQKENNGKEKVIDRLLIGNWIGDKGTKSLCETLITNSSLKELNMKSEKKHH